jgi:hypothetical protein
LQLRADLDGGCVLARLVAAGDLVVLGGRVSRRGPGLTDPDHLDVPDEFRFPGRGQDLARLGLRHGPRRASWLSRGQVDELGDVLADQAVLLCAADGPSQRALDHHQRPLAENPSETTEEPFGVRGGEVLQLD